ncbi:probable transcriptional regulatory protein Cthe_2075 isoform X2 [Palaemon carinicauda]|uniref:probable transcriptional regulatory protein Cthe_2075 isoform X2 n=1 Tax=Palaemon carinicauda TaxID=392227 RepID=UPI0035B5FEFD
MSSNDLSKLGIILHTEQNNLQNVFKSCLNCTITASKVYRLPSVGFQMKCLYGKSLLFGTLPASSCSYVMRGMAGHSKWSNIKHIKAANDAQKQKVFTKFSRLMRFAIKEGGSADPRLNSKLGKIVDQAKGNNMPMASIENVLKSAQKSQDNGKPYLLEYRGPGGAFLLAEVLTDNLSRSKQNIVIATKKLNMQELKTGAARCLFDEKGVIVSTCEGLSFEQAMDHAIEIGAEDVTGDEGSFVFTSAPEDFSKVKQALEENNYTIKSANVEFVACNPATISDQDMEKLSLAIEKMEELDDVMKVHVNL